MKTILLGFLLTTATFAAPIQWQDQQQIPMVNKFRHTVSSIGHADSPSSAASPVTIADVIKAFKKRPWEQISWENWGQERKQKQQKQQKQQEEQKLDTIIIPADLISMPSHFDLVQAKNSLALSETVGPTASIVIKAVLPAPPSKHPEPSDDSDDSDSDNSDSSSSNNNNNNNVSRSNKPRRIDNAEKAMATTPNKFLAGAGRFKMIGAAAQCFCSSGSICCRTEVGVQCHGYCGL